MRNIVAITSCAEGETKSTMNVSRMQADSLPDRPATAFMTGSGNFEMGRELSRDELIDELSRIE